MPLSLPHGIYKPSIKIVDRLLGLPGKRFGLWPALLTQSNDYVGDPTPRMMKVVLT